MIAENHIRLEIRECSEISEHSGDSAGGSRNETFEVKSEWQELNVCPNGCSDWYHLASFGPKWKTGQNTPTCVFEANKCCILPEISKYQHPSDHMRAFVTEDYGVSWWELEFMYKDFRSLEQPKPFIPPMSPSDSSACKYDRVRVCRIGELATQKLPFRVCELASDEFPSGLAGSIGYYQNRWMSCITQFVFRHTIPQAA